MLTVPDYIRRLDVVNRGFRYVLWSRTRALPDPALTFPSGYNTRQALAVLPSIVPSPEEAKIRFLVRRTIRIQSGVD